MNEFNEALDKFIDSKEHEPAPVFGRTGKCVCGWPEYAHGPYTAKDGTMTTTHAFTKGEADESN